MSGNAILLTDFAPTGCLRASINLGNPILANKDSLTGLPVGLSVDLAHAFAKRLGVALELVVFESAGNSVDAVENERADVGFFALDPLRGREIAFTAPYVLIEGCYLVHESSPLQHNEDVDQTGTRVTVGAGSAYDLYLSRELSRAQIVHAVSSPAVVDTFLAQGLEVAAGVRQQLEADLERIQGLRLLPGHFMVIKQAMGIPKSRGLAAAESLARFVEDMKTSGFVQESIKRHGIHGATVAPKAPGYEHSF